MNIVPERQVTISRTTAMHIANARAAVERFAREFEAWQTDQTDTVKPPDMMTAAIEFRSYLENILGGLDDALPAAARSDPEQSRSDLPGPNFYPSDRPGRGGEAS